MSDPADVVYRRYYNMITEHPGLTLSEYAHLCHKGYTNLKKSIAQMEYHGYLLIEGPSETLWPYKIVERHPDEIHNDPISRDCRWRRTGRTQVIRDGIRSSRFAGAHLPRARWYKIAGI